MTRRRHVAMSLTLGVGLVAMHCLAMLMPDPAAMPMATGLPMEVAHASGATHGISGSYRPATSSCGGHACIAARGAETTSPMATPGLDGGLLVTPATRSDPRGSSADLLRAPRPPPRSGPCSPLCVWRV